MEAQQLYNISEIIILVLITAIGTGAFLGFSFIEKKLKINFGVVLAIFVINLLVVCVLVEILRLRGLFDYRYIAELGGSYLGMYFLKWVDKNRFNLFDALAKKVGIEPKEDEQEQSKDNL